MKQISVILSTFSFAAANIVAPTLIPSASPVLAQTAGRKSINPSVVAITIPNFRPSATYTNGQLNVSIPQALLAAGIDQVLRANEGRVKDTEFQKVDISNMRFSLVREPYDPCGNRPNCLPSDRPMTNGLRVDGRFQFQFREKIGCAFGKCHYTPWSSISGNFSQPLYFRVANSRLDLNPGGLTLRGDRWYADAVAPIANLFGVQGQIRENLRRTIQDFNGMDLRQVLIEYGSQQVANQLGVNQSTVNGLINVGNIGAVVSEGSLIVSVPVRLAGCRLGGTAAGANCLLTALPQIKQGVNYWLDTDPRWPGVYYSTDNLGVCAHGGSPAGGGGRNCIIVNYQGKLQSGVNYWLDTDPRWPGVYYRD